MRALLLRGGAVWQLVGLITRRSQVQILPPLPTLSAFPLASGYLNLPASDWPDPGAIQHARACSHHTLLL